MIVIGLITHENIGDALLSAVRQAFGELPLPTFTLAVHQDSDPDRCLSHAETLLSGIANQTGALIFTDIMGATPFHITKRLCEAPERAWVCGVSLPMLFRVMNHPELSLTELIAKACSGGHDGIITR